MPVEWRSSRGSAERRSARMPQCASETRMPKSRLSIPVRIGLPIQRFDHGIAPSWIVPFEAGAEHEVVAGLERVDERAELVSTGRSRRRRAITT